MTALPTGAMVAARFHELRKRRGLMITLAVVTVGIPTVFLVIRLLLHAFAPETYGPAGGFDVHRGLVSGVLYTFGFIVAAALGATAGSADLGEGVFRHLVITGRSRVALYLARIPAGLSIIVPLVGAGFAVVCTVCVLAAPTHLDVNGVAVPANLSRAGLEDWGADHATDVICRFDFHAGPGSGLIQILEAVPCQGRRGGPIAKPFPGAPARPQVTQAQVRQSARRIAGMNYAEYSRLFLSPSTSLMIKSGLWLELEVVIGVVVGLGLGSLVGQRTVAVIAMVILEIVLTPILSRARIPHLANLQRSVVGLATAHLAPGGLPVLGGGDGPNGSELLSESTRVAVVVILAWLVGWTILGAWRMATRDA
jgi:hypothetical protein